MLSALFRLAVLYFGLPFTLDGCTWDPERGPKDDNGPATDPHG